MVAELVGSALTVALCAYQLRRRVAVERESRAVRDAAREAGLVEPPTLHPVIDPTLCVGCGSCVEACPENQVLGLIEGKADLINPTHCIGHGACKEACPADAIQLVFGTETRGVDIPFVSPEFETNVPGLFIAGELAGMGLIRNAIEQGRQALGSIRKRRGPASDSQLDVVIVGAGPAGLAASLSAKEHGLRFVTLEQESLGGTVSHYPRGKIVMTAPATLPLVGKVKFTETTKESLLGFWEQVVDRTDLKINFQERLEGIRSLEGGFSVASSLRSYATRSVLLAIGRRGTPRRLGVPGEDLPKVVYRLIDAEQYRDRRVLVVGGGDSALEAAASIAEEPGTAVVLSYRSGAFTRAREKNRRRVEEASASGSLRILLNSRVRAIEPSHVLVEQGEDCHRLENDAVIISAGGVLPTPFLEKLGIRVDTKYGTS